MTDSFGFVCEENCSDMTITTEKTASDFAARAEPDVLRLGLTRVGKYGIICADKVEFEARK